MLVCEGLTAQAAGEGQLQHCGCGEADPLEQLSSAQIWMGIIGQVRREGLLSSYGGSAQQFTEDVSPTVDELVKLFLESE